MTSPKISLIKELQTINSQLNELEKKIHEIDCKPDPCSFMTIAYQGMETGVAILKERREKIYERFPDLRSKYDGEAESDINADLVGDLLGDFIVDICNTPTKDDSKKRKTIV